MLRHVLLLKLKESAGPDARTDLVDGFRRLTAEIPNVAAATFGPALGLKGSSGVPADFAVLLDFATPEDFAAYIADPRHQAFVRDVLAPVREAGWSAQIAL